MALSVDDVGTPPEGRIAPDPRKRNAKWALPGPHW
jgi:hypothetical protein